MTYVPDWMPQPTDAAIDTFLRNPKHHLGMIIAHSKQVSISYVPLEIQLGTPGSLDVIAVRFHLAAKNEQVAALVESGEVVIAVRGAEGVIEPEWYDHENVPTWDYAVVHFTGSVVPMDEAELWLHLTALLDVETPRSKVSEPFARQYLPEIRGFHMAAPTVNRIFKLSQDKSAGSIVGVREGLQRRAQWLDLPLSQLIADVATDTSSTGQPPPSR